ncbi:WhiB family transcriptional regulator [Streptacidiphilus fuscans]|uniref:WhiB family transcriptional regulator n=1 Tax=Streptacidiphilus fuscans TaxID=2789292 RepID=A0A931BE71_9ACTN|nr:WhiB family transcriptional regulator [Streptacidiphilus fuscans]MBF9071820.1 WhiB family transcriptional regulator [Streptacidiphilus fuscans]
MNHTHLQHAPALPSSQDIDAWRLDAACAYIGDPDVFFADIQDVDRVRSARMVCRTCPVNDPCLNDALNLAKVDDLGIRAGTTTNQRKHLRLQRMWRCDQEHVDRVLGGIRGVLSAAERDLAVVRAVDLGLSAERLASALRVTPKYAREKISEERKARLHDAATDPDQPCISQLGAA